MRISFLGAAGEVTGSNHLIETQNAKILFDCGLFQGDDWLVEKNYEDFDFDPSQIDAVFLSHAHLDHCGRLPKLVKHGFQGKIYATAPTIDLTEVVLLDAAKIMEEEHDQDQEKIIYQISDVQKTLALTEVVEYDTPFRVKDFEVVFKDAGHILGSAFIEIKTKDGLIAFSGDLGNSPVPLLDKPDKIDAIKNLLVETTYGDGLHDNLKTREEYLSEAIEYVHSTKGTLMIPAFALERTQEILYILDDLIEQKKVEKLPIFLDSPMAIEVTDIFKKYKQYLNKESQQEIKEGDDVFSFTGLTLSSSVEQSKSINQVNGPKVIIAGSGMLHGGRILHHLIRYLSDKASMLLFVGYQVEGTLGRRIIDGERKVKIFNDWINVNAKIANSQVFSSHADQKQLLDWISPAFNSLENVYLVHGEKDATDAFKSKLCQQTKAKVIIPDLNTFEEV